jgi:hypothetical protein
MAGRYGGGKQLVGQMEEAGVMNWRRLALAMVVGRVVLEVDDQSTSRLLQCRMRVYPSQRITVRFLCAIPTEHFLFIFVIFRDPYRIFAVFWRKCHRKFVLLLTGTAFSRFPAALCYLLATH